MNETSRHGRPAETRATAPGPCARSRAAQHGRAIQRPHRRARSQPGRAHYLGRAIKPPPTCSIAAACDKSCQPARLLISKDTSLGRRRFSVLHEYAHFLRDLVPDVLEVLFTSANAGEALEERMCDEFASAGSAARHAPGINPRPGCHSPCRAFTDRRGASIGGSVRRGRSTPSPRARVCNAPIARRHRDLHRAPQRRLLRATRDGARTACSNGQQPAVPVRGREQVRYSTGNRSQEMLADAATENGRTVAVLVTDSPPWGGLTVGMKQGPEGNSGYCGNCAREFNSFARSCDTCEQPPCPECGQCACETPKGIAESAHAIAVTLYFGPPHTLTSDLRVVKIIPDRENDVGILERLP